jgi:hypothetical protein
MALTEDIFWGRFHLEFSDARWHQAWFFNLLAGLINLRSKITGICTGDQCLFVRKNIFEQLGGYENIPLMEDISLSKKLKQVIRPHVIEKTIKTSARRWQQKGILKTVFLMWLLRFQFWLGKDPNVLSKRYAK